MRWERPGEGSISPAEFIPVAERSGLIISLGDWALETACEQAVAWRRRGLAPIRIAVNLSGVQIRHAGLPEKVSEILSRTGLAATELELEITETAIRPNDPANQETLEALHERGIGLALDDFGTGTSSLAHLRRFPIQRVKIDRSFIAGVPDDFQDTSLTAAIIAMAHSLGLTVVGEGVETEAQANFLAEHGCDVLQGYLFSRPVPPEEIATMLARDDRKEP
jgi:EAL domain-containing protein (putative c-di-GMP-specific phosphodiesterase class I)